MGGDDSQKLLPWRGIYSSPGRKPPAQLPKSTISLKLAVGISRGAPWPLGLWPQLRPAWVIFGKHRWVNSDARRRTSDQNTKGRFDNDRSGYRLSTSVGGAATGEG